jgi:hypothetical protein
MTSTKDAKMKTYHWTNEQAAQSIRREGFSLNTDECGGRQWGRAIYLATDADAWVDELRYVGASCEALLQVEIADNARLFAMDGAGSAPRDLLLAWGEQHGHVVDGRISDAGYAFADTLGDVGVYGAANLLLAAALKANGYDGLSATAQSGAHEVVIWNLQVIQAVR